MDAHEIATVTAPFEHISLDALNQHASLQTRADNKYFVPWSTYVSFMQTLRRSYLMLEIAGRRVFTYDTQYFDSQELMSYWGHVQGRRKRFKCRSRHYVDSGLYFFELKLKGGRGETIKHKMVYTEREWPEVSPAAAAFLHDLLHKAYGFDVTPPMLPTLRTKYQRITLTAPDAEERVTCDLNLAVGANGQWQGGLARDYVLIETKSERGRGQTDQLLWRLGARPTSGSKYCLGMSLIQPELRSNPFLHIRKRYFVREHTPETERTPSRAASTALTPSSQDIMAPAAMALPTAPAVLFE